jgi:transcriptional regulator with XRE-family HTH domain
MVHFGERLREQRLARGIELSRIADETRIMSRYLEALERGDSKQLPGAVFARSFAKQYAAFVGVDYASIESEVVAAFPFEDSSVVNGYTPKQVIDVKPLAESWGVDHTAWRRPAFTLAAVLAVCSVVYLGWQRLVLDNGKVAGAETAAKISASMPAVPPPAPAQREPEPAATMTEASAMQGAGPSIELQASPGVNGGVSLKLVATQATWVSLTANGKRVFSGLLQPNESRVVKGVERATMIIGNAGGLEVQKDGQSIGPIGPPGQVRVVQFSPEGTKIRRQGEGEQPSEKS